METDCLLLPAALLVDCLIGDPRSAWHPVVLIGRLIGWLEKKLLCLTDSAVRQKLAGVWLVLLVLTVTYCTVFGILHVVYKMNSIAGLLLEILLLSFAITPRSLAEAGREIRDYLTAGEIGQARYKVGWIVGRDTEQLDDAEVTRATVETVAENIVDGIISPLFYFALGGAPLAFLYRAVNTLDSMVGYKNDKYRNFGMTAARVDDVFNYIPARITGFFLIAAACLLGYRAWDAARMIWRDAAKHPSPNSGIAEAGTAGALGVRLGGCNLYGGVPSLRAYMGEERQKLQPLHITQTIRLMYGTTMLFSITALAVRWLWLG